MNEPKISVVVPAYNIEKYISDCLISIQNQTYKNIEVIVINDGSTDGTLDVIKNTIQDDDRFIIIDQKNTGVSVARKNGIEKSTGEYIGFIDGDDTIEPNMFQRLIYNALKYNADISHCGHIVVYPNKKIPFYGTGKLTEQDNFTGLKDLLDGAFIEPGLCNKLFNRKLFKNINYDELKDIKNNEDLLLNFYLFSESQKSVHEDFCPYHYIQRAGSASNSQINEHQLFDPLKVISIIAEKVSDNRELFKIAYSRKIRQYIRIITAEIKNNPELKNKCKITHREFIKMLKQILTSDFCSIKLKIMSVWVALSPFTYMFVHKLHNKIKYKQEDIL